MPKRAYNKIKKVIKKLSGDKKKKPVKLLVKSDDAEEVKSVKTNVSNIYTSKKDGKIHIKKLIIK